ncbi:MAG: hypothetical protein LBB24_00275 [Rickettsiales bacterium]|jgi:hypothetical protein|nr:hypothetical protein [Rickettsiales bacterium]
MSLFKAMDLFDDDEEEKEKEKERGKDEDKEEIDRKEINRKIEECVNEYTEGWRRVWGKYARIWMVDRMGEEIQRKVLQEGNTTYFCKGTLDISKIQFFLKQVGVIEKTNDDKKINVICEFFKCPSEVSSVTVRGNFIWDFPEGEEGPSPVSIADGDIEVRYYFKDEIIAIYDGEFSWALLGKGRFSFMNHNKENDYYFYEGRFDRNTNLPTGKGELYKQLPDGKEYRGSCTNGVEDGVGTIISTERPHDPPRRCHFKNGAEVVENIEKGKEKEKDKNEEKKREKEDISRRGGYLANTFSSIWGFAKRLGHISDRHRLEQIEGKFEQAGDDIEDQTNVKAKKGNEPHKKK